MSNIRNRRYYACPRPNIDQLDRLIGDLKTLVEECANQAGSYYPKNLLHEGKIQVCYFDRNGKQKCQEKKIPMNLIDLKRKADECLDGNENSCRVYINLYSKLVDYIYRLSDSLRRSVPPGSTNIGIRVVTRCLPMRPRPGQGYIPGYGAPILLVS